MKFSRLIGRGLFLSILLCSCSSDDSVVTYYDNGGVKQTYKTYDDQMHGLYFEYYPNGYIAATAKYMYGKKVGYNCFFSETDSGQVVKEQKYAYGTINSKQELVKMKKFMGDTVILFHHKERLDLQISLSRDTIKINVGSPIYPFFRAIVGDVSYDNGVLSNNVTHYGSDNNDQITIPLTKELRATDYIKGQVINFDIIPESDSTYIGMMGYEQGVFDYFEIEIRKGLIK
jgi:major membrane immunogen (membrane-anchored lipoprotein)